MRGRGGHSSSSSSAIRQQIRMALRKQLIQNISCDSQQDENTQDEASADTDSRDEVSSLLRPPSLTREKRQKERENHSNQKEMTEEEMMDLALQLSKQEASNTALKKQREDEDVMKAIQESMINQTQPCLNSPSKSPLDGAPLSTASRQKLSYSNGEKLPGNGCTLEGDMNSEVVGPRGETITRSKKRKRGTGSPLLEMPDLSQTQMSSQNSPSSPESFSAHLDSPQSSSSTHIDDSQLQMSPVFPLTGCKAEVHINRLNSDLVETCKSTGFVLCSQDRLTLTQSSAQSRSPIFPQSNQISSPKSPVFPGDDEGNEGQPEWNPKFKSPVFGKTAECEMSLHASKHSATENAEFGFFTQESLIPTVRSCPPQSPVLPKRSSDWSLLLIDPDQGQVEQRDERSTSPVFGLTDQQVKPAELRGSEHDQSPPDCSKDIKSDGCQTAECNRHLPKSVLEELIEKPKGLNSAETYLTSDRALVWSEQDEDDVLPVGSPSPVFPEEKVVVPNVSQPGSSPNHLSESSQEPTGPGCSLKSLKCDPGCKKHVSSGTISASTSTNQQQFHTSGQELHLVSRQEVVPPPGEPSGNQTINYYWGVPFCPRSLDPDTYTQVIMAQMEVYEKSLKQAQRGLLRKAEWGEAIQPQPQKSLSPKAPAESHQPCVSRRRGLRLRGSKRSEAAGFLPDEEEERKDEREDEQQDKEEEEKEGDEVQIDTDCEVCLETQLSDNNSTKDLSLDADTEAQPPQKSPELPEIEMVLRDDVPTRDMPLEQRMKTTKDSEMEENVSGCREDAGGQPAGEVEKVNETRKDPGVEEMEDRGLQRSESPELEAAVVPHSPETSVDCPICQGSFPASEIEMHAAYCDGEVTVVGQRRPESQRFQDSVKPRRKRMRRTEAISEETTHLSVSRTQEKCFICQKSVPPKDYSRHTELCLQRGTVRRAAKGNLLSALEQTESRDSAAGPSGSKPQPEAVIDLRDDDDDEDVLAYRISNSPIRSFTPISEATGCLIDFRKQQRTKKPSQRRR